MASTAKTPRLNNQSTEGSDGFDITTLSTLGVVAAALAYGTGILTVNIYLHKLGITDFSFAKPKLVLTGTLVLVSLSLLCVLPTYVAWDMANRKQIGQASLESRIPLLPVTRQLLLSVIPLVLLLAATSILYFKTGRGLGQISVWETSDLVQNLAGNLYAPKGNVAKGLESLLLALQIYIPVCLVSGSVYVSARLLKHATGMHRSHIIAKAIYLLEAAALPLASILVYVYIIALTFYPVVPPAYGGGKPYFEQLVVAEDERCEMLQLGIPFPTNQSNVTLALPVLHESDSIMAVLLKRPPKESNTLPVLHEGESTIPALPKKTPPGSWLAKYAVVQIEKTLIHATQIDVDQDASPPQLQPMEPNVCKKP
jgi:hypothetical protein